MPNIHVPDYLILPFGRAVRSDLQKVALSAVSADGLYFSTEVPVIYIRKSDRKPISLSDFEQCFGDLPVKLMDDDETVLNYIRQAIKQNNPDMTKYEEMFVDLYFDFLTLQLLHAMSGNENRKRARQTEQKIGINFFEMRTDWYKAPSDVWRALLPIPELQLYVQDPLASVRSYEPKNNFRVDYGFWDGERLTAVEIDGAEPEGYAKDIRRDRLLRRAGVDVIHILNLELEKHKARALDQLLPTKFFGVGWDFEGQRPGFTPF